MKLKTLYNNTYSSLTNIQKRIIPLKILFNKKRIYKKYIKEDYDVEIAFLEGPITRLLSVKNKKTRKIAWIHNDISQVFGKAIKAKIKKMLDKKIYSKYETLVFVSKDNLIKFKEEYKDVRNEYLEPVKKEVIYNYIDKESVKEKAEDKTEIQFDDKLVNFLTVARLVPQKAIDRLINVHTKLIKNGFKHNFYIIGDGPEKEKLEKMINDNQIQETFKLFGKKENPYPYVKNADYFCLLSHFEGYPMVVEEAKILNKYILITNTAAREVVRDYKNSQIFENSEEGIYNGLKDVITNFNFKNIQEESEEYDNSNIIKKIEHLVGE